MRCILISVVGATLVFASACGHHQGLAPDGGGGSSSQATTGKTTSTGEGGTGGGPVWMEPDLPPRWSFVNGVVDRPLVQFCFVSYPSGTQDSAPFPSGGLGFGKAIAFS